MAERRVVWLDVAEDRGVEPERLREQLHSVAIDVVPNVETLQRHIRNGAVDCIVFSGLPTDSTVEALFSSIETGDSDVPIITITSEQDPDPGISSPPDSFVGFLQTPCPARRLVALVKMALEEREAASQTEHDYIRELADITPDVLWLVSGDWENLLFVNSSYEEIWGHPVARLREDPTSFVDAVHPDDREAIKQHCQLLSAGESAELEFRVNPEEDYNRWVWVKSEPIMEDGEVRRIAGFTRDITDQKQYERELEHQNKRLDDFAHVVAHDLRNPLNLAGAQLQLARETGEDEHLEGVDEALNRLDDMINDMLQLAKEGKAVSDPQPVPLGEIATEAWEIASADAPHGEQTIHVDESLSDINGDADRVRRLLSNLFSNAIQHGGSNVSVHVGSLTQGEGFFVADNGPGIPQSEREDVFDAGYTTSREGTGYGLAIVAEIATAHGWDISVGESEEGGARVEICGVQTADQT